MKTQRTRRERAKRGRTPLPEDIRKGSLIQTRVDGTLEETLREAAKQRRVSVSQLIRNVLEDTFHLVDNVVADAGQLAANVKRDAKRVADAARGKKRDPLEDVEAWQEVVVGRTTSCEKCIDLLERGDKALMGVSADPNAPKVWLCTKCGADL
ncbi:MAG TPA: hypothetical protein VL463_35875 [Kofleriaceae bacterium]|jgi:hypothetical protein|nr:hypothetical protein [Kofleriaceae bacterium]